LGVKRGGRGSIFKKKKFLWGGRGGGNPEGQLIRSIENTRKVIELKDEEDFEDKKK